MASQISIAAGRSQRREGSKFVDALPEKGTLELRSEDGEYTHFTWKNRVTGQVEDELLVFPGEATFEKVDQDPSGRTHILKFSSSDQKYFFWIQKSDQQVIIRAQVDIDNLIRDPTYRIGSAPLPVPSTPQRPAQERSWPPTPGAPRLSHPEPAPRNAASASTPSAPPVAGSSNDGVMDVEQIPAQESAGGSGQDQMARLLAEWARGGGIAPADDDARLTDVLSPIQMSTLLTTHPSLIPTITPLLPSGLDLPPNPSAQDLLPILSAPQFTDAIASLDNALRSGGLPGNMMRELGLPDNAGQSVKGFLEGLIGLKKDDQPEGGDERMDED
ncbi:uncharacterized protein I206_107499 [Kwoniella pini CBS 10737]|uniref:Uncharacterized protein n=1 Tax=Kwoniella pini CBS 10737 TaxID=1296096 RepID=A0A1B9HXI4_9TREE|nr:uncharacterized protein I206_05827 [Kwoniella pini CBS 10737]OCF47961.1 hypothetical protein I206_05827 [Kwoniella pini CBS 10737]